MENSKIEWTDHTFNPWIGCRKISAGCQNCYAETIAKRFGKTDWNDRVMTSEANWKKPLMWDKNAAKEGIRRKVFCASMADVFDEEVPDEWRDKLFELIHKTTNLDWLLLTKRPEKALKYMNTFKEFPILDNEDGSIDYESDYWIFSSSERQGIPICTESDFMKNVWLGVTVENQEMAEKRIPILLQIPAAKRFLSCEPMLGEIDLKLDENGRHPDYDFGIDWIICGGESGHKARPINPEWVRSLRNQCFDAGIPFFFKQWGEYAPMKVNNKLPGEPNNIIETMVRVGKKNAGRLLDGREWNEVPS